MILDKEKKKREEEAKSIINMNNIGNTINSINYANLKNMKIETKTDEENNFINKVNEANNIINSINARRNEKAPNINEEDRIKSLQNAQGFIDLIDSNNNNQKNDIQEDKQEELYSNDKKIEIFKAGALSNGYQPGDFVKSNFATQMDIKANLFSGLASIIEAPIDILTNVVATVQDIFGFDEAAKGTRQFANTNYSEKMGNFIANTSKVGILYNIMDAIDKKENENLNAKSLVKDSYEDSSYFGETSDKVVNLIGYTGGLALGGAALTGATGTATVGSSTLGATLSGGNIGLNIAGHTLNLPTLAITGGMASSLEEANTKEDVIELQRWTKAISGGLTEGVTEGIFGLFGVGGNDITDEFAKKITKKISTSAGKMFTKLGIQATGESLEEFMSYVGNYFTDNVLINNIGSGDFSTEWDWEEVGEQMALAFVSTTLSSGGVLSIQNNSAIKSAKEQLGRKLTTEEKAQITQAVVEEAQEEKEAIQFNPDEKGKDVGNFFVTTFNGNGELTQVEQTIGKQIENPNKKINVNPVIIKNKNESFYNIIDSNTGVLLDTTPYETLISAQAGFNDKMLNLDDATEKGINEKIRNYNMEITNSIIDYSDKYIGLKESEKSEKVIDVNKQISDVISSMDSISNNSTYKKNEAISTIKNISNNIKNIDAIEQSGMTFVNSLDKDGNVVYQQKINSPIYNGAKIKSIINNAINNADLSDINLSDNQNTNIPQTSSEQNIDNLNTKATTYTFEKVKSIVEPFSKQQEYTVEEMADIWNNEVDKNDLQSVYDNQGNLQGYVSIQEDGDKLVVNSYDSNDNIISSEVIPSQNGKYTSKAIKDTIEKVTGLYEQNKASKTQDINTINLSDNEIRDIVKYNPDGREITDQDYVDFMVERYKDNKNISGIETNTEYVKKLSVKSKKDIISDLYNKISEKKFKTTKQLKDKNNKSRNIILNLQITKKGINESLNKGISNEKMAIIPYLDILIKTSENGIIRDESKQRSNINDWYYLYNTAKINGELYSVKIDIRKTPQGDRFYVHRVNLVHKKGTSSQIPAVGNGTIKTSKVPSTDTSISQKDEKVKSDTDINSKSMQVDKNYTPKNETNLENVQEGANIPLKNVQNNKDDNIKSLKKNTSKLAKTGNIKYNSNGIKLGKKEYAGVVSAINTDNPNLSNEVHGKFFNSSYYIFEKFDFDNYHFIGKIGIQNNEELINMIIGGTKNGTLKGTKNVTGTITEFINGRGFNNTNNDSSKRTRKNIQTTEIHSRYDKSRQENNQKRNNNQSLRNQPRGLRGRGTLNNDDNVRSMKANNVIVTDNKGRKLSKEQQEYFKDSKARDEKGNLIEVYHGTNNNFNEFDISYLGSASGDVGFLGDGFYVATHSGEAGYYGNKVMKGYVNIQSPFNIKELLKYNGIELQGEDTSAGLEIKNLIDLNKQWENIEINSTTFGEIARVTDDFLKNVKIEKLGAVEDYSGNESGIMWRITYKGKTTQQESITNYSKENIKTDALNDYIKRKFGYIRNSDIIQYITEEKRFNKNIKSFREILEEKGYDSIVQGNPQVTDEIVLFNSNQFKNIDNTNPTLNDDIRYMKTNKTQNSKNEEVHFNKRTAQSKTTVTTQRNAERQGAYIEEEIKKLEATGKWDYSIPKTSLTDIRKTIEDYLGLNIKKGHFRQHAYAIYKGNRDVIRTKEYKDIDSILHETGHALDIGNRLKIDKETIADELLTAIDKLGGYEQETRTVRLEEGFAEVIREYSVIPNQAKIDYPQTIAILEKLRQNDKSFNNFIEKVQQQTYNYIHQSPRNRELSNQSIGQQTDKNPLSKERIKEELIRKVWDKDYLIKETVSTLQKANGKTVNQLKASDNAYYLTRLMNGIGDKVSSMLANGYIDENGNKLMPGLNQIGEILENKPERFDDLRAYLVARRDTDYRAKGLKTGLRYNDSLSVIEQFKNDTQIQEAAQLIYNTLDGVMQYAVRNGLISQETANSLKESNAFYIPMQRVLENRGNQVGRKGSVQEFLKKRTGSELDIKDVLENIIANSTNVIQQVENNNVLKALYKQGEASGLTGAIYDVIDTPMIKIGTAKLETWKTELEQQGVDTTELDLEKSIDLFAPNNKIDRQNLITSFIDDNGKRVYLQFNDKVLFESFMGLDTNSMSYLLRLSSHMNMPLRYGATMANIGFAIPNMISDTAQATIFSTAGFIPVVDNAIGVLDILAANNKTVRNFLNQVAPGYADKINNLYTIYQQTGATNATRLSQYRKSTQNIMKDIYGTKNSKNLGIDERFKPLKRLLDIMTYIPELSEQSTRFRVFQRNYDYYLKKGNSETDARIMAALESRDATQDFSRTGTVTREINQLIPFSAARVGSSYTFAEKVKANPKQISTRIALLTVIAMGIKALGYDDDEIEEVNQRKKDDNFVFKIGDNIVTIKKPQGILRSMINLAEYIQDLATGHIEEGKEREKLGEWINNAIMDNMPADDITGLVPNMIAPLIENAINKDFYYNNDIVKSYDLELPDSQQYYEYNSQLAILLGQVFNYSPAKIDNLISGYFGTLGTSITNIMDYVVGKIGMTAEKPEMGAESDAVGKRFIINVNSNSASIDEIYDRKTELTKKKNGETITDEESAELETIANAISNMSKLNKQIKEIKKDLSMSGKEKADEIKLLQQQKTDIARQALGKSLIHPENESNIESTQFYPTQNSLSKNKYQLELSSDMKKEYEQLASEYYNRYAKQGIYSEEKLQDIKSKAKEYAKNQLFQKYKSNLVKTK